MKDSNLAAALSRQETEFQALKRQQFRIQADIANARAEVTAAQKRRDEVVARILPVSTELGEKLRLVKTMEEDLVAAKQRQAAIQKQLADMAALQQKVAAAEKLARDIAAADAAIAKLRKTLADRTATIAELQKTLQELAELGARIQRQLGGGKPKEEPAGKPVKKK